MDKSCGSPKSLKILISVTETYLDILTNWLVFYHRICPSLDSIHLLCFDTGLKSVMYAYGLPCRDTFKSHSHKSVFTQRVQVAKELLEQGHDVMMADIDALFVRNPFPDIITEIRDNSADIIASRGFFPFKMGLRYGASLCMGLVYFRATEPTKVFMGEFLRDAVNKQWHDDQRAINDFLAQGNLSYGLYGQSEQLPLVSGLPRESRPIAYHESARVDRGVFSVFTAGEDPVSSSSSSTSYSRDAYGDRVTVHLSLLPHLQYRRVCHVDASAHRVTRFAHLTVAHCLIKKTGALKESILRDSLGLWALPDKSTWSRLVLDPTSGTGSEGNVSLPWNPASFPGLSGGDDGGKDRGGVQHAMALTRFLERSRTVAEHIVSASNGTQGVFTPSAVSTADSAALSALSAPAAAPAHCPEGKVHIFTIWYVGGGVGMRKDITDTSAGLRNLAGFYKQWLTHHLSSLTGCLTAAGTSKKRAIIHVAILEKKAAAIANVTRSHKDKVREQTSSTIRDLEDMVSSTAQSSGGSVQLVDTAAVFGARDDGGVSSPAAEAAMLVGNEARRSKVRSRDWVAFVPGREMVDWGTSSLIEYLLAAERDVVRWDMLAALQLERTGFSVETLNYDDDGANIFSYMSHACDPAVRQGTYGQSRSTGGSGATDDDEHAKRTTKTRSKSSQAPSQSQSHSQTTAATVPLRPLFFRWSMSKYDTFRPPNAKAWPGTEPFQSLDCSNSKDRGSTAVVFPLLPRDNRSPAPSDCPEHGAVLVARQRPRQASPTLVSMDAHLAAVNLDPARILISLRICENMGPVLYRFPLPLLDEPEPSTPLVIPRGYGRGGDRSTGPIRDIGCIAVPLCV